MARPRQPAKQYPRVARLNELVLECLAVELERLSDPRLGFVTLTGVEVNPDLRSADVYYSVLGAPDQHAETAAALDSAGPHLRASLGRQVRMKYLPALRFREDPSVTTGDRVEEILRELHTGAARADDRGERPNGGTS
ncbi:MAG: 30S ribosome-binding factor RbfA [Acidimicrobiia bacterium]